MANVNVDDIWLHVGHFGRYQKQQVIWYGIAMTGAAYVVLVYVFAAYRPSYSCKIQTNQSLEVPGHFYLNRSDIQLVENSCGISVMRNMTNQSLSVTLAELPCKNGYTYAIEQDTVVTEWDLVCKNEGKGEFTQSLVTIGQIVGALIFLPLADKYGRKKIFVSLGIMTFLSSTIISLSPNYYVYSVMKFLSGALMEGSSMVMYIYIYEMFPQKYRAYVGVFDGFWWAFNVVSLALIGFILQNHSWKVLHVTTGMVCAINVFTYWLCDESLRWLIVNGRITEAKQLIKKVAVKNGTTDEMFLRIIHSVDVQLENNSEYKTEQKRDQSLPPGNNSSMFDKGSNKADESENDIKDLVPADLIKYSNTHPCKELSSMTNISTMESEHPTHKTCETTDLLTTNVHSLKLDLKPKYSSTNNYSDAEADKLDVSVWSILRNKYLLGVTLIWMFAWLTASMTYFSLLLSSVQWEGNRFLNFFISGLLDLPSNILYWILVNRVSRKRALICCHLLTGIPLIISAILLVFKDRHQTFGHVAIAFSFMGKIGIGASHGILYAYTPETFPTNLRNIGLGLAASAGRIGGIVAPFSSFVGAHIEWVPSVVFGVCCIIVSVLGLLLPETKDRQLPQTLKEIKQWNKQNDEIHTTNRLGEPSV